MAAIGNLIRNILYPRDAVCIACGRLRVDDMRYGLCEACAKALIVAEPPFCPRCGKPGWAMDCMECIAKPPDALDGRRSAFAYEGVAARLVRALKYQSVVPAATALADGMLAVFPEARVDGLVPVPLHRSRYRRRGFNQSQVLASQLSRKVGLPVLHALHRIRATRTQTRLSISERTENVRGVFECSMDVGELHLLLIDDVMTTGSTAISCANALKASGAARVYLLTAARAGENDDL